MLREFYKVEAAENDFVLVESRPAAFLSNSDPSKTLGKLCHRHSGIGADGFIFLQKNEEGSWTWDFFNSDGSSADVCGNAARCAALYIYSKDGSSDLSWRGSGGLFRARLHGGSDVSVSWPIEKKFFADQSHSLSDFVRSNSLFGLSHENLLAIECVKAGVPHVVLLLKELCAPELREALNPKLRHHSVLGEAGANVTWFSLADHKCVTFERGVEAETRACGSGAVAAFMARKKFMSASEDLISDSEFFFPGGRLLVRENEGQFWLRGSAHIVYKGSIEI